MLRQICSCFTRSLAGPNSANGLGGAPGVYGWTRKDVKAFGATVRFYFLLLCFIGASFAANEDDKAKKAVDTANKEPPQRVEKTGELPIREKNMISSRPCKTP